MDIRRILQPEFPDPLRSRGLPVSYCTFILILLWSCRLRWRGGGCRARRARRTVAVIFLVRAPVNSGLVVCLPGSCFWVTWNGLGFLHHSVFVVGPGRRRSGRVGNAAPGRRLTVAASISHARRGGTIGVIGPAERGNDRLADAASLVWPSPVTLQTASTFESRGWSSRCQVGRTDGQRAAGPPGRLAGAGQELVRAQPADP